MERDLTLACLGDAGRRRQPGPGAVPTLDGLCQSIRLPGGGLVSLRPPTGVGTSIEELWAGNFMLSRGPHTCSPAPLSQELEAMCSLRQAGSSTFSPSPAGASSSFVVRWPLGRRFIVVHLRHAGRPQTRSDGRGHPQGWAQITTSPRSLPCLLSTPGSFNSHELPL